MVSNDFLLERLNTENIWHKFIDKPETVHTADASRVSGIDLNRLTKNLIAKTSEREYVLLIVPGTSRIDLRKAANVLGTKNVSLVPFDSAEAISGYPPGGTPSIYHKQKLRVLVDKTLLQYETLYCGGGSRDKILELKVPDVVRIDEATVADITKIE